jgi:hypothetical protein
MFLEHDSSASDLPAVAIYDQPVEAAHTAMITDFVSGTTSDETPLLYNQFHGRLPEVGCQAPGC